MIGIKFHSQVDLVTNSSTVLFTVYSEDSEERFREKIEAIYTACSHLPFPFTIKSGHAEERGYHEFDAGYYWGFTMFPEQNYDDYAEEQRFKGCLKEVFGAENVHWREIG